MRPERPVETRPTGETRGPRPDNPDAPRAPRLDRAGGRFVAKGAILIPMRRDAAFRLSRKSRSA